MSQDLKGGPDFSQMSPLQLSLRVLISIVFLPKWKDLMSSWLFGGLFQCRLTVLPQLAAGTYQDN